MKLKCLSLMIVACLVPVVVAAGPSRACDDKRDDKRDDKSKDRDKDQNKGRDNRPWRGDVSPEEMQAALKLYQDHSKRRWEEYRKLDSEQQKKVATSMLGTYRMLRFFTRNGENLTLWDNKIQQIQIEDEIFGYRMDLLRTEDDDAAKLRYQEQIRAKIAELVDKRMEEKSMRIASLEKLLKEETDKLAKDMINRQTLIDEMFQRELSRKPAIVNENRRPEGERDGGKDK